MMEPSPSLLSLSLPGTKSQQRLAERRGIPKLQLKGPRPATATSSAAQTQAFACHSASLPKDSSALNSTLPPINFVTPPPYSSHRTLSLPSRTPGSLWSDSSRTELPRLASLTERKSAELLSELAAAPVQGNKTNNQPVSGTAPADSDREVKIQSLADTLRANGVGRNEAFVQDSTTYFPPTPTTHGYDTYFYPIDTFGETQDCEFDVDAFSSNPPTPISPSIAESTSTGRSRTSTLLSKVIPHRIRAGIKRRISPANSSQDQPPSVMATTATTTSHAIASHYRLHTPPDEDFDRFFGQTRGNATTSSSTLDDTTPNSPELVSPAMTLSHTTRLGSSNSNLPRKVYSPDISTMDVYWEGSGPHMSSEWITSPLHPPTVSPSLSPSFHSSRSNLVQDLTSNLPAIYPTSPALPRRPSTPIEHITADSLADMIEAARKEDEAYEATYKRMAESGWSSERELQNVKVQRQEAKSAWDYKIGHAKRLLEVIKLSEAKAKAAKAANEKNNMPFALLTPPPARNSLRRSISAKSYLTIRPASHTGRTQSR